MSERALDRNREGGKREKDGEKIITNKSGHCHFGIESLKAQITSTVNIKK